MAESKLIGIIGGYGAIGQIVAKDLLENTKNKILLGGRNKKNIDAAVKKFGKRTSGKEVDVYNEKSLADFCRKCSIVINCTGPSWEIKDLVLKAALASSSNYVDPGIYYDKSDFYNNEFKKKKLTALLYAGWVPGITGILPRYLYNKTKNKFRKISSLHTFCGDRSGWSPSASIDILHHFLKGVPSGFFEKGEWVKKSWYHDLADAVYYKYPDPVGKYIVSPIYSIEHKMIAAESKIGKIGFYAGIFGFTTLMKLLLVRYIRMSDAAAVKILKKALLHESEKHGQGGAVVAEISGTTETGNKKITAGIYEKESIWLTGICTSLSARMILSGKIKNSGVHFLCDAADPEFFINSILKIGVKMEIKEY